MAELEVSLMGHHAAKAEEVETEWRDPNGRMVRNTNWVVSCLTCGWEAPSRFRSKRAAVQTAFEHREDMRDTGVLFTILDPQRREINRLLGLPAAENASF